MENEDFERRFEIYKMSRNKSLVITLFKDANERQRQKILDHEKRKLKDLKNKAGSDAASFEAQQKELLDQLKKIK